MLTMLSLEKLKKVLSENKKAIEEERWQDIDTEEFKSIVGRIKNRIENILKEGHVN